MRYIITTGGTGGHIFPALALIEEIQKNDTNADILFVGTVNGMEEDICSMMQIPFKALKVRGFMGKGIKSLIAAFLLISAFFKAKTILKEFKADMVIGFGGYASAPCVLAAKSMKVDIYLHEQNSYPGAVNRYFAPFAKKIMLAMPVVEGKFSKEIMQKCVITGNPVRANIAEHAKQDLKNKENKEFNLLVIGGSLGAHSINELIISMLDKLCHENINIVHQCGKKDYDYVKNCYDMSPYPSTCVFPFIEDIKKAYHEADIVIARAGATSLAELACMKKAAIIIPFPHAAHNHQYHNAQILKEKEACMLLEEKYMYKDNTIIDANILFEAIVHLKIKKVLKMNLENNIVPFAKPDAAKTMYDTITQG